MDYNNYSGHQSQPYSLYGLPTPDQQPQPPSDDALGNPFSLNSYNQYFSGFDPSARLDPSSSFVPPPHSPPDSFTKTSVSSNDPNSHTRAGPASTDGDDNQFVDPAVGRSSSEEKESMTPAQTKRKAQNRAAQRAFRERKERHVKDLEDKVTSLEESSTTLQADNERLKRELAKFATENEILRATSHTLNGGNNNNAAKEQAEPTVTGPMKYTPTDFFSSLNPKGSGWQRPTTGTTNPRSPQRHRITVCQVTGEKLLDAGETWDFILGHDLFKRGEVDIGDVTERLKGLAQCDGTGPAFRESQVCRAIEDSAAERDELI
ncbi:hypothetical protein N7532_004312 [Penicillium argentinense]|uniref:BZIP domain-containing protein n=1 Tax=Penicillium argentinense TaxID=1131581 RepID=A0A9W9KFI8_9EURO|nr:uncharacterized protein N7532_004312 [Penicillium argentinense]KAJ5103783.1 hypothetical protein N7532_004312 [Penicillium argentinense]